MRILPDKGLMYVRYSGAVSGAEGIAAYQSYVDHDHYKAGQKHLIDFSEMTGFANDFPQVMALQALMSDTIMSHREQTLFVFCAPTPLAQTLCHQSAAAWDHIAHVIVRVLESEEAALDVVGLPDMKFADLLESRV